MHSSGRIVAFSASFVALVAVLACHAGESAAPGRVAVRPPREIEFGATVHPRAFDRGEDPGGRGLDMRLGGNRANIPKWKSGCVVCLFSCPGSKVGNARYTVRDWETGVTRFRTRAGALPLEGTPIRVVMRLASAT